MRRPVLWLQACGLYPMIGTCAPAEASGVMRRRNTVAFKTRKAETVSLMSSSSVSHSVAAELALGPAAAPARFLAYEELTRGADSAWSSLAPVPPLRRRATRGVTHGMRAGDTSALTSQAATLTHGMRAGDTGTLTTQAATLVPAAPLLLVASRLIQAQAPRGGGGGVAPPDASSVSSSADNDLDEIMVPRDDDAEVAAVAQADWGDGPGAAANGAARVVTVDGCDALALSTGVLRGLCPPLRCHGGYARPALRNVRAHECVAMSGWDSCGGYRWLQFAVADAQALAALACLRVRLSAAFQHWCLHSGQGVPERLAAALAAASALFLREGATRAELHQLPRGRCASSMLPCRPCGGARAAEQSSISAQPLSA
jgi:hypothetical protein